jgi:hypothetical protein
MTYISTDYIKMNRCFWEELPSGQTIKKNVVINHHSIQYQWDLIWYFYYVGRKHTNNAVGKESINPIPSCTLPTLSVFPIDTYYSGIKII